MEDFGSNGIKIATVLGSSRSNNYTSKALRFVIDEIQTHQHISLNEIELGNANLSFPGEDSKSPDITDLRDTIQNATGVILATPEYHGSFSSIMKLFIENLGFPSILSTKPVALLGVAAGEIGAIKSLEHLSSVCSHIGAIVLPGVVSVANVRKVFDKEGNCLDNRIEKRIRNLANSLINYIQESICPKITLESMVRESAY